MSVMRVLFCVVEQTETCICRFTRCTPDHVKSSHYYLYSAFNNANCVKAALHQLDIKLGGFTSALQYLDGEIVSFSSGQTKSAV